MYKCNQCPSVYATKRNLARHLNKHAGVRFSCTFCPSLFLYKHTLVKHTKKFHSLCQPAQPATPIARQSVINVTPSIGQPTTEGYIQITPQIFVPDAPAGGSNITSNDDQCMAVMDNFEYQDIANAVNECKEKWKKIKDTYMKSKNKLGTGSENAINNPYSLAFLDKVKFERSTITNVSSFSPSVNEMVAEYDDVDENEDIKPNSETDVLSSKNHAVDLFFKSIAETVKKCSIKSVSEAKLKVLKLILEIEKNDDGREIN